MLEQLYALTLDALSSNTDRWRQTGIPSEDDKRRQRLILWVLDEVERLFHDQPVPF